MYIADIYNLLWSEAIFAAAAKNAEHTYQCWPDRIWFNVLHGSGKQRQRGFRTALLWDANEEPGRC